MSGTVRHNYFVTREMRGRIKGHRAKVIWFIGLSGAGKSTIANLVERELFDRGIHSYSLDGDNIRSRLNKGLKFSKEDRTENLRRVAEIARLFHDAGIVTLAAFITPLHSNRAMIREIIGKENLVEVFVKTSLEECERRDIKGFYQKARTGEISDFTGINAPFEIPENPHLVLDTEKENVEEAVEKVISFLWPMLKGHENALGALERNRERRKSFKRDRL